MNSVIDLAARATSFITLMQDTFIKDRIASAEAPERIALDDIFCSDFCRKIGDRLEYCLGNRPATQRNEKHPFGKDESRDIIIKRFAENTETNFDTRAIGLIWISSDTPRKEDARVYTQKILTDLSDWIYKCKDLLLKKLETCGPLPTPYNWREAICEVLYTVPSEPSRLAAVLQYLPIQVVLAAGGASASLNAKDQRLMQLWKTDAEHLKRLLNEKEQKQYARLQERMGDQTKIEEFINDSKAITNQLREIAPLPFELIFNGELEEIRESRRLRNNERCLVNALQRKANTPTKELPTTDSTDPFKTSRDMKLYALAFSGGGIRSATFNLGILQSLAREGLIGEFDYLSTVSGGGYIGSWLAAWIQRNGSVTKVSDRLNPDKSPDPFAEEVRPIRWLRMFSNYFTPMASIMSIDAWTIGVTWLRNTLLNQVIIVLLLLTGLLGIRLIYEVWICENFWKTQQSGTISYVSGSVLILAIALLAGLSMRAYHGGKPGHNIMSHAKSKRISQLIMLIMFAASFVISASLFWHPADPNLSLHEDINEKFISLLPASLAVFFALLGIAVLGKYYSCITAYGKSLADALWQITYTAFLSAAIATFCLVMGWELLQKIRFAADSIDHGHSWLPNLYQGLAFISGIPIILLVFGITVVARMAFLGKYFPDERREWWGRMGAQISRTAFLIILLAGSSLLGLLLADAILDFDDIGWKAPATLGGWMTLVGASVKAAFSGKTSGKGDEKGIVALPLKILSMVGPYLFALGLLVFLPALLIPLYAKDVFRNATIYNNEILKTSLLMILSALPALWLAGRVGVNEFSMHHFYRNRLVRAYLGATRRGGDRKQTANPFTNFDMNDDLKLSKLLNKEGYFGPYPILNTALNSTSDASLDRQDRKAESFIFSPLYCGFDFSMTRASTDVLSKSYDYGYRPTELFASTSGDGGPEIGSAMAISGAAVNPNQGYHSSPAIAFLLTIFNVQLGWWIGNPRKAKWQLADPEYGLGYIVSNLAGSTSTRENFVSLSDGGHFDNMGLYELVRRRCTFIVLGDGEQDDQFTCEGLANAIRRCRIDFGAIIDINVEPICSRDENRLSKSSYAVGSIHYAGENESSGVLLYIKSSITGTEPVDVREYTIKNKSFPQQTTADQFFDEAQFESYRQLGLHIGSTAFKDPSTLDKLGFK